MANSELFSKKIKELTFDEIEYTEDFFNREFGSKKKKQTTDPIPTLKASSRKGAQPSLSPQYSEEDIDTNWMDEKTSFEGQLAVDVVQTEDNIVIVSTVAGVKSEDLDIDMNGDMITIKGIRRHPVEGLHPNNTFIQECYWGGFSRSIILPVDIQHDKIKARLENGVLTITLPKASHSRNGKIAIEEA